MKDFLSSVLKKIDGNPERLGEVFSARLTHQEELMLGKLDDDITICVEKILDKVLQGANAANNGEMNLSPSDRDRVMLLTAVRRSILKLVKERGCFNQCRDGLN